MELDAERRAPAMPQSHHDAVFGLRVDHHVVRQAGAIHDERVIARRAHRRRTAVEQPLAVMPDLGDLAVLWNGPAHNLRAECLADRLMPKADAEEGDGGVEADEI